jgi:hypothetical protein
LTLGGLAVEGPDRQQVGVRRHAGDPPLAVAGLGGGDAGDVGAVAGVVGAEALHARALSDAVDDGEEVVVEVGVGRRHAGVDDGDGDAASSGAGGPGDRGADAGEPPLAAEAGFVRRQILGGRRAAGDGQHAQ